jgi:hypothetical protein
MPLSDDQKAMLRLLAQREQGYDDLAALMGLSVDEVRAKVKDALAQLEQEGEPLPALPSEPEAPAPTEAAVAPEVPQPVAPPPPPAPEPVAAEPPKPAPAASPKASAGRSSAGRPKLALPKSGGARAALAAGAAVLVALILILVIGGGSDSSDTTTTTTSTTDSGASEGATGIADANPKLTQAVLAPLDGGDAKGLATFGRVKNSLALQIEAEGLAPTAKGQSYTVWLYDSGQKRLPLASTAVDDSGRIGAQVEVPTEVLAYLAKETFDELDISLTSDAALKASLAKATKDKSVPGYTGTDVLRGPITGPIIGAADKVEGE